MKRSPTPDYEGSHRRYNEHTTETLFERYVGKEVTIFKWSATGSLMPCLLCGHVVKGPVALPCRSPTRNTMESSPLTALSAVAAGPSHSTIPPPLTRFRKPPLSRHKQGGGFQWRMRSGEATPLAARAVVH